LAAGVEAWLRHRWREWMAQHGQSLVELALFFPILLLILAGLIEVGYYANNYLTALDASREGARMGADGDPDPSFLQVWTHTGGVRGDPMALCDDGPIIADPFDPDPPPADPDSQVTDIYAKIGCLTYRDLHPLQIPTGTARLDDIVVSIYAVAPISGTYEVTVRPNITDDIQVLLTAGLTSTHLHDGYYSWLNRFDPANPAYAGRITEEQVRAFLDANPPAGPTAFVLVEVWWEHNLLLNLPFTQRFIPDPLLIHAHTLMPMSAAEPTATPGPSPTPRLLPTATASPGGPTLTHTSTPEGGETETPTASPTPDASSTPTPTPSLTMTPTPTATPGLPKPWQNTDVGDVGVAGSADYAGGQFTVSGSGADIWQTNDEFHFVHQTAFLDYCQITARVVSIGTTNGWSKAGVMFKQNTSAGSNYALMSVTESNGLAFQWNFVNNVNGQGYALPVWLQLVRDGNLLTGYYSTDGLLWTAYHTASVAMFSPAEAGLFVTSHNDGALNTVTFDNVSFVCAASATATPTATPSPTPTPTPTLTPTPAMGGVQVNFQPPTAEVPAGYLMDGGAAYGNRGNGFSYGWNLANTNHRERNSHPDQRYDTLNHMQLGGTFTWEIGLPNGDYWVTLVMGDPSYPDSVNHLNVEGVSLVDPDGADTFDEYVDVAVKVSDGRLTISPVSGGYAKICFVEIRPAVAPTPTSTPTPSVTPTLTQTPTPTATPTLYSNAVAQFSLDTDPGWSCQGQWQYGVPTGGNGSHGLPDPTSGATGSAVYGYNLSGGYTDNMPEHALTTTAIDCSNYTQTKLRFWRWLNVERAMYDHATVRISADGQNWTTIWQNLDTVVDGVGASVADSSWVPMELDISAVADNQPTVYIRWVMGPTDGGWTYSGWNIDDVEVIGMPMGGNRPLTPVNQVPPGGALVQDPNPVFIWSSFNDPDFGDHQTIFQLQLRRSGGAYQGIGSWDTGPVFSGANTYEPAVWNLIDSVYCWHVRVRDSTGLWSPYSSETCFTADVGAALIRSFSMDLGPDWIATGAWQFGIPQGRSGDHGLPDPVSGATGENVYGYNLAGAYTNNLSEQTLTTGAIDCTGFTGVTLRFMRWLNVERAPNDWATVRVSSDGANWTTVWENPTDDTVDGASVADSSWQIVAYDISAVADNQPTVYLRWVMGPTDGQWTYSGWNLDDVELVGSRGILLSEDFESYAAGANPVDWRDQRQTLQDADLYQAFSVDGTQALGTSSTETNIYSHYVGAGSAGWQNYQVTGRLRYTLGSDGVGVTFYSQYPMADAYYRLRAFNSGSMHISPHPDGKPLSGGTTDTGVSLSANAWYRFRIQVETVNAGTRVNIRAKVWPAGAGEPANWQVDCWDETASRFTNGTIGFWTMGGGNKYLDDVEVRQYD